MASPNPDSQASGGGSDGKAAEVSSARDRLSGALSFAVDQLDREEFAAHGVFGSPSKRLHSMDVELGSPTKNRARRRRKKEVANPSAFHHTFVMKLFDRSVDLAQFNQGTALYPVCRAWMINDPMNTNMAPRQRTPTPEPRKTPTPEPAADKPDENTNGDGATAEKVSKLEAKREPSEEGTNGEVAENGGEGGVEKKDQEEEEEEGEEDVLIYKMPNHLSLPVDDEGNPISVRVPDSGPSKEIDEDFFDKAKENFPNAPNRESLLNDHMVKWFKVRRRWREAAAKNEERYKPSMDLLREMFEK